MTAGNGKFMAALAMETMIQKQQAEPILKCNETTEAYGLVLTHEQALALEETRTASLKRTGRIELGGGITDKLIMAFYDSPYISKETYVETLQDLIDLFYNFKNETQDLLADDTLIGYMKKAFDGECRGSVELLAGDALPALAQKLRNSGVADLFKNMEITDD